MTSKPAKITPAALRHRARIDAAKQRIEEAQAAQRAASRRGDFDTALSWLGEVERCRHSLQLLRTLPISTVTA